MARSMVKRRGIRGWLDDRMGLGTLVDFGRQQALKPVPRKMSWAYTLGTLALFYFALQFVTGCLLLMRYAPDAQVAYETVQNIQTRAEFGWLFRQMHSWGASFVVLVLIFHMLKVLWYGSYKRPREFTWFVGVLLLALTLGFCFTGYILPWNQLAKWATVVGTESIGKMPWIGDGLKELVLGGNTVSGNTLGRFFAIHVFVLPLGLLFLVAAHMILIRWKGITPKLTVREEAQLGYDAALEKVGAEPFFPRQVYRELLVMILGFAVLVTFATFFPWHLHEPASNTTPLGIKPEWYFLPVYQGLKYFEPQVIQNITGVDMSASSVDPALIGIGAINLFAVLFFFLPVLDRGKQRKISRRPFFVFVAGLGLLGVLVLGVLGYLSQRTFTFAGREIEFSHLGYPEIRPVAKDAEKTPGDDATPGEENEEEKDDDKGEPPEAPSEREQRSGREIIAEIFARHRAPPPPAEAFVRKDGREAGGTCVDCHRSEARQWRKSVHAATNPPTQCSDCHGGIDSSPLMIVAHQGIFAAAQKPGETGGGNGEEGETEETDFEAASIHDVPVRAPEGQEVVEICGRCHVGVRKMFSPLHMQGVADVEDSAVDCHTCHSNHKIEPAGLATFERAKERGIYTRPEDPRTTRFQECASAIRRWWGERRPDAETALAKALSVLESNEFPVEIFARDLDEGNGKRRTNLENEISWANHSLDPKRVEAAIGTAEEHLRFTAETVSEIEVSMASRWKFAAGVWAVTVFLAMLIILKLRGLDPTPAPAGHPRDAGVDRDDETHGEEEVYDDSESHGDEETPEARTRPPDTETETGMGWINVDDDRVDDAVDAGIVPLGDTEVLRGEIIPPPDAARATPESSSKPGRVEAELDAGWMGAVDRPPSVDGDLDASWLSTAEDELDGEPIVDPNRSPDPGSPGEPPEEEPPEEERQEQPRESTGKSDRAREYFSRREVGAIFKRPLEEDELPEEEFADNELAEDGPPEDDRRQDESEDDEATRPDRREGAGEDDEEPAN